MISDISKITLDNIENEEYEPKKKYTKNLPLDYRENQLLTLFKEKHIQSYKNISENLYGNIYVNRATIQRIIKNLRRKGHKIKTISNYGFEYENSNLLKGADNIE